MRNANATTVIVGCVLLLSAAGVRAQDWPQWRGPNRDAKVTGFKTPKTWPKELTKKWTVTVGRGVATPALVGDKLYVFTLEDGNEVTRCLDAAKGEEIWKDKYEAKGVTGFAAGRNGEFSGPRSSPTVAEGKVVTLGVQGTLSCLEASTGKKLWRKNDFKGSLPMFSTASSPIVVDGLCIAQLGSSSKGAIVAYDLATGKEKWKWTGDGTAYASPVLTTLDGTKATVAETEQNIVAVADGKLLWKTPFPVPRGGGRGGRVYNACTPLVDGQTIIFSGKGRGTKAVSIDLKGDKIAAKDLWTNKDNGVQFSTPVLKNGLLYGISDSDKLFCIKSKDGKTAWTSPGAGSGGYGSIVDLGPVLLGMNPNAQLIVFESSEKEFKEVAKYKLAVKETYAYPVVAGNRIFIKDRDSITLWTIE
jgi:outer membrane protein assembly factor BamB